MKLKAEEEKERRKEEEEGYRRKTTQEWTSLEGGRVGHNREIRGNKDWWYDHCCIGLRDISVWQRRRVTCLCFSPCPPDEWAGDRGRRSRGWVVGYDRMYGRETDDSRGGYSRRRKEGVKGLKWRGLWLRGCRLEVIRGKKET